MTRIRWTADRSGIAHAHVSGRTLCHAQAIAERDAWPETSRCQACVAALRSAGTGGTGVLQKFPSSYPQDTRVPFHTHTMGGSNREDV
jgi:hypothetical protein